MVKWQPGKILNGRYKIEKELGSGGFADTYLAYYQSTKVVIKTPNSTVQQRRDFPKFQQYFRDEAERLKKFNNHPHIVKYQEVFEEQGLCCIVMEYINGEDLGKLVIEQGVLAESIALKYIQQIGEALTFVHGEGILHRDVKPENIIKRKNQDQVVLIDFGIAREFTFGQSGSQTQFLSNGFAPPEQYFYKEKRGDYTDVYALAATLYVLLTGYVTGSTSQVDHYLPSSLDRDKEKRKFFGSDLLQDPKEINPKISDTVSKAILKGMELDYKKRPQTVQDWLALLQPQSVTQPVTQPVTKVAKQAVTQMKTVCVSGLARLSQLVNQSTPQFIPEISEKALVTFLGGGVFAIFLLYFYSPYLNKFPQPVTIDYEKLEKLLANKEFQEADEETLEIMLLLARRQKKGWLDVKDIQNFPCSDLEKINKLWRESSEGRFGFTAQKWIWIDELGGKPGVYDPELADKFGDLVAWRVDNEWHKNIIYAMFANPGHLPYKINVRGFEIHIPYWAERLDKCNIP
ncbi:serine/threonine-protein kinase [Planktothricoides raciborskii]|uniref:non-specific serine/threonine protein kinase n=2 Tax=Planktothricoides raciborskii TaxID=132608 RepID=A0AAU8JA35_9CYAN|nr:serine/threonine-protein kinase [Planktothricoides raciborskii]MBD2543189.1 GUN4 domain-containing protein [Planktothricoides raciborskii FACHB-1370]MBD2580896.1 GUN4 domain-containing protein [Planktothricoides raciborskii FACHB-1261]